MTFSSDVDAATYWCRTGLSVVAKDACWRVCLAAATTRAAGCAPEGYVLAGAQDRGHKRHRDLASFAVLTFFDDDNAVHDGQDMV